MWAFETFGEIQKWRLDKSRKAEFPPGIESAAMYLDSEIQPTYDMREDHWDDKYVFDFRPRYSTLRTRIKHNSLTYDLGLQFYNEQEVKALAKKVIDEILAAVDDNAEKWVSTNFELELLLENACQDSGITITKEGIKDRGISPPLVSVLKNLFKQVDRITGLLYRSETKEKEGEILYRAFNDFDSFIRQTYEENHYVLVSSVQRGYVHSNIPKEVENREPLSKAEMRELKPYLVVLAATFPQFRQPFMPRERYQGAIESL